MDLDFAGALDRCLSQIPPGRVATCGAIGRALGDAKAARAVATWLVEHPETAGAHRVVRADGRPILHRASRLLVEEGIRFPADRVPVSFFKDDLEGIGFLERLREEQRQLRVAVRDDDDRGTHALHRVAGVDVSYRGDTAYAAAISVDPSSLETTEVATIRCHVGFPYIPSYLAYRELPGIHDAVGRLSERPDLLLVDGHGLLHPAGFGIACHVGVSLDLPTIGVAKHVLAGRVQSPSREGDVAPVRIDRWVRGYAWIPPGRSRSIYVSVGHRVSLERATWVVREVTRLGYPEPLRIADRISKEMNEGEKREKGALR